MTLKVTPFFRKKRPKQRQQKYSKEILTKEDVDVELQSIKLNFYLVRFDFFL